MQKGWTPSAWCCLELLNGSKGKWVWRTWVRESSQTSLLMSLLRSPNNLFGVLTYFNLCWYSSGHATCIHLRGSLKVARVRKWETFFGSLNSFEVSIFKTPHFIGIQGGCHNIWSTHNRELLTQMMLWILVNTKIMFSIRYLVEISVREALAPWYWKNCDKSYFIICYVYTFDSNSVMLTCFCSWCGSPCQTWCLEPLRYLKIWQELSNISHSHSVVEVL